MSEPIQIGDRFEYIDDVEGPGTKGTIVTIGDVSETTAALTFPCGTRLSVSREFLATHLRRLPREPEIKVGDRFETHGMTWEVVEFSGSGDLVHLRSPCHWRWWVSREALVDADLWRRVYTVSYAPFVPVAIDAGCPEPGSREIITVGSRWQNRLNGRCLTVTENAPYVRYQYDTDDYIRSSSRGRFLETMIRLPDEPKKPVEPPPPPTCKGCSGPVVAEEKRAAYFVADNTDKWELMGYFCDSCCWKMHLAAERNIARKMAESEPYRRILREAPRDPAVSSFVPEPYEPSPAGLGAIACRLTGTMGKRVR